MIPKECNGCKSWNIEFSMCSWRVCKYKDVEITNKMLVNYLINDIQSVINHNKITWEIFRDRIPSLYSTALLILEKNGHITMKEAKNILQHWLDNGIPEGTLEKHLGEGERQWTGLV